MPVRRWAARLPVHRGPRPRGRPLGGGAARRRRHPRRPGQLLLPRRTGLARVVPVDGGPQHDRDRRGEPVRVRRTLPLEHPGDHDHPGHADRGAGRADLERRARRVPATEPGGHPPPVGDAGLAGPPPDGRRQPRDRTHPSMRSSAGSSVRTCRSSWTARTPTCPGRSAESAGRAGCPSRRSSTGPCTEARSTRSRAGTPPVSALASRPLSWSGTELSGPHPSRH